MTWRLVLVGSLAAGMLVLAQREVSAPPNRVGEPLGALEADFVANAPGPLENRPLLIEFWATWCPSCRRTVPQFNQLHAKYKDQGLVVIGLSDEPADVLQAFIQAQPTHFAVASDPEGRLSRRMGITFIPYCVLVDASGKIVWQGSPHLIPDGLIPKVLAEAAKIPKAGTSQENAPTGPAPAPFRPGPRPNWY
ncbi:MAG: hypothetical protein OHK005_01450 [Candidatus Methylacidiphilales bacterium]